MPPLRLSRSLALAVATTLALPAVAAAQQSFSVNSPTGFPAGGDPSYTTNQTLDSGHGAPGAVVITLAPGVLASLAANPDCVKTVHHDTSCEIGTGSASTSVPGLSLSLTAYLVPPTSGGAAGIDLVSGAPGIQPTHVEVNLQQTSTGNVQSVLKLDLSSLGAVGQSLKTMSLTVNSTLGGKPFTRMPSNCSPGHSSLTITYSDGTKETTQASPDFTPTGCSSLPFNPALSASAVKDPNDSGVKVVTTQTQALGEAAGLSTALALPWPALSANTNSLSIQNTSTPVGTAVASSPLQPTPLAGMAYLTGGAFTPTLTLRFPPPVQLTLVGTVDLNSHIVTFSNLPDVPQTSLVVTLFGGAQAAEATTCAPPGGTVHASFTGQNGKAVTVTQPLTISGCPSVPSISHGSLSGVAGGRPALRFTLAKGSNAPTLKSFVVTLPHGLTFSAKKLRKGISVSAAHTLRLRAGALVVTLKPPAASVSVSIHGPALVEGKQLKRKAGAHPESVQITVTDASGSNSSFVVTG